MCLFLLDMGLIAARRILDARSLTWRLVAIAIVLPLVNGAIGTVLGVSIGLDTGSAAALGVLCASASYIAVPAAMRLALPEAGARQRRLQFPQVARERRAKAHVLARSSGGQVDPQ